MQQPESLIGLGRRLAAAEQCQVDGQRGFILLIAMVGAILPLVLILGAAASTMTSRLSRLDSEINDERALLAAESGIDQAVYLASTASGLTSGVSITRNLGSGVSFTITPTRLDQDHVDNNHNGVVDEPAENQFQVLVTGRYLNTDRRLVAYLAPQPPLNATMPGAVFVTHVPVGQQLTIQGASNIDGHDTNMDDTAGPGPAMPGAVTVSPQTVAQLQGMIPGSDQSKVNGAGASPSLGVTATGVDFPATQLAIQNSANVVLSSSTYNNLQFGNGLTNTFNIIYRNGDVDFRGNTHGAGIMFINGNLNIVGGFRFDGIIYVTGSVDLHGNTRAIYGALVTGPNSPHIALQGTTHIIYSSQAISRATAVLPTRYLVFNGWQELRR